MILITFPSKEWSAWTGLEVAASPIRVYFISMGEYKVKGSTIRSKLIWIQSNYGEQDRTSFEKDIAKLVPVPPPYMDSSWYPFEVYVTVCEQIAKRYFSNNLAKLVVLGEDSAEKALGNLYKSFTYEDFRQFMEHISDLHRLFYNKGHTEIEFDGSGKKCFIHHRNKDRYSEADLFIALGFYRKAAEIHKCKNPACFFSLTDGHAIFTLKWD